VCVKNHPKLRGVIYGRPLRLTEHKQDDFNLLDHVEDRFVFVEPDVVIGNCHRLKGDLLCVLEKGVRPPDLIGSISRTIHNDILQKLDHSTNLLR
jgi:hypothetical protein